MTCPSCTVLTQLLLSGTDALSSGTLCSVAVQGFEGVLYQLQYCGVMSSIRPASLQMHIIMRYRKTFDSLGTHFLLHKSTLQAPDQAEGLLFCL